MSACTACAALCLRIDDSNDDVLMPVADAICDAAFSMEVVGMDVLA